MYIIHDIKNGSYYTSGTQTSNDGRPGPRWTAHREAAIKFATPQEAKQAMYRLKHIKNQDNRCIMYEKY